MRKIGSRGGQKRAFVFRIHYVLFVPTTKRQVARERKKNAEGKLTNHIVRLLEKETNGKCMKMNRMRERYNPKKINWHTNNEQTNEGTSIVIMMSSFIAIVCGVRVVLVGVLWACHSVHADALNVWLLVQ